MKQFYSKADTRISRLWSVYEMSSPGVCGSRLYSYLLGKQEDQGLKPAVTNRSQDPISKNTQHKTRLLEWLKWKSAYVANVRP